MDDGGARGGSRVVHHSLPRPQEQRVQSLEPRYGASPGVRKVL